MVSDVFSLGQFDLENETAVLFFVVPQFPFYVVCSLKLKKKFRISLINNIIVYTKLLQNSLSTKSILSINKNIYLAIQNY